MTEVLINQIRELLPSLELKQEEPMRNHTTFRVGGPAELYACPSLEQLPLLMKLAQEASVPVTVIGNGSNLLVGDRGIRGLVVELGRSADVIRVDGNQLTIGAGTLLSKAANAALAAGLGGMEFAAGIPGSVGGAVAMNAGAYGGEMKDILLSAEVLTPEGEVRTLSLKELDLSYRHSCIFEKNYVVLKAVIGLTPRPAREIEAQMNQLREQRIAKQPLEYPSAGSTFKRPTGYFAGKLIQDAGLRGYTVGGAQVSEKHCGFVINRGNATAADILQLIRDVQERVQQQFGVSMETEVRLLGDF